MKLKTVTVEGKTYAELTEDGKPIYVHDDGKEIGFDAPASVKKIGELNREAQGHREAKEAVEAKFKPFEGIEDPAAALEALKTVENLGAGELKTATQVEEIKIQARRAAEEQVADVRKTLEAQIQDLTKDNIQLRTGWDGDKISTQFANSKFVSEKLVVPGPVVARVFQDRFKIEDGRVVGLKPNGDKIFSRANPGEIADFDEALAFLVDQYPHRESLVRGVGGGSGGGRGNGNGSGMHGAKTLTRQEFDAKSPAERTALMSEGYQLVDATP